uniref:Uncharacterized protein n=1 Tax=Rhizophora mucronata TaxID=61149 RepID=A0A2P2NPD5_RHIMU
MKLGFREQKVFKHGSIHHPEKAPKAVSAEPLNK